MMKRKFLILFLLTAVSCLLTFNTGTGLAQINPDPPFGGDGSGGFPLPGMGVSCETQYLTSLLTCSSAVSTALNAWQNSSSTCTTNCQNNCATQCRNDCYINYPNDPAGRSQCESSCNNNCSTTCPSNCQTARYNSFQNSYDCYGNIQACQPQLDVCGMARAQRDQCLVLYPIVPEYPLVNAELRMACMLASGIDMCE